MSKQQLDTATLAQFTGSENFIRYSQLFRRSLITDGVHYVAETVGAYWLLDVISSHQARAGQHPFQVWKLIPNKTNSGALVVCEDGNNNKVLQQRIPFTDFPFIDGEEFVLWAADNGQGITIMLPSEY